MAKSAVQQAILSFVPVTHSNRAELVEFNATSGSAALLSALLLPSQGLRKRTSGKMRYGQHTLIVNA